MTCITQHAVPCFFGRNCLTCRDEKVRVTQHGKVRLIVAEQIGSKKQAFRVYHASMLGRRTMQINVAQQHFQLLESCATRLSS